MATTYELPKLPATADELAEMKNTVATTPVGGAVMFIAALIIYSRDHVEGLKALTVMTDSSHVASSASPDAFKGFMLNSTEVRNWKDRLGNKDYCARSYVQGTSPSNGYLLPETGPYKFIVDTTNPYQPGNQNQKKVFIHCTGADNPRPMVLSKNDKGLWKGFEYSSLQLGVRAPVVQHVDDL